jgi:hypothetical protein
MKVELLKRTVKIKGDVYYYVTVDEYMHSIIWTSDYERAFTFFNEVVNKCRLYPEDKTEILKTETI